MFRSNIEEIKKILNEIKIDNTEIKSYARIGFRILFGAIIAIAIGLSSLMAKGFGWL